MTVLEKYRGVLFDLDGVLTPTALVHMRAWSALFTPLLERYGVAAYTEQDYFDYIDGKPRFEGVAALLASRGIELPRGAEDDAPGEGSVCALGNRKNAAVGELLDRGVAPYPGSLDLVRALAAQGTAMAVVSSSHNAPRVLAASGLAPWFPVVVDGAVAQREHLAGKPASDTFVFAARALGLEAAQCVVVEDAVSGVAAGAAGAFGLVVGVDRGVGAERLSAAGADIVVGDLAELVGRP